MWICPICSGSEKLDYICKSCGFDERTDFVGYRTLCPVPEADINTRKKLLDDKRKRKKRKIEEKPKEKQKKADVKKASAGWGLFIWLLGVGILLLMAMLLYVEGSGSILDLIGSIAVIVIAVDLCIVAVKYSTLSKKGFVIATILEIIIEGGFFMYLLFGQ